MFVRNLFWIHPNTKVIHPSNRGLLSYLDKDEAQNIINKKPQLISDLELYKKINLKLIDITNLLI